MVEQNIKQDVKSVDRLMAEAMWKLLDDIDTFSDACKPTKTNYYGAVMMKVEERFKYLTPDPKTQELVPNVDLSCGLCECLEHNQLSCFELKIIEKLSALEHEQWMHWATKVLKEEPTLSDARKFRWAMSMIPYEDLSEDVKEHDKVWARKVLNIIKANRLGE